MLGREATKRESGRGGRGEWAASKGVEARAAMSRRSGASSVALTCSGSGLGFGLGLGLGLGLGIGLGSGLGLG